MTVSWDDPLVLRPVNAEAVLVGVLSGQLGPVAVGTRVPNPRPASFVRVQRTGGDERNLVQERPVLLVECWGVTDLGAWALASAAWSMLQGRDFVTYNGIELEERRVSSPVNFPDPTTASPRYQFTLQTTINLEATP